MALGVGNYKLKIENSMTWEFRVNSPRGLVSSPEEDGLE
jgi:hypothetical protein